MAMCDVCKAEYGEGDTVYMGQGVHRLNRCHDVLAARVAEMESTVTNLTQWVGTATHRAESAEDALTAERAAHAITRARFKAAERVVEAARALEFAVLIEAGARESMHAPRAVLSAALTHRADVLAALDAAASSRAGDDDV